MRLLFLLCLTPSLIYAECMEVASVYTKNAANICKIIKQKSLAYNIREKLIFSIAEVESGFTLNSTNGNDFGIMQINEHTIKTYDFDKNRLMSDLSYSIDAGVRILADKKRRWKKVDNNWFIRYNTGNRPSVRYGKAGKDYCKKLKRVCKWK